MQQRRLRLGDVLDDYCPRERRVTNHAIVAMIDDEIKQTRCTTCDAEHEFKRGRMPTLRRKKDAVSAAYQEVLAAVTSDQAVTTPRAAMPPGEEAPVVELSSAPLSPPQEIAQEGPGPAQALNEPAAPGNDAAGEIDTGQPDGGRVHRRLIRAMLPRLENQPVVRPIPEFTMHQPPPRAGKFRGGMVRGAGSRPGGAPRGGHANPLSHGPAFGRQANPRGAAGRSDVPRHGRGQLPARHSKKHSK
jgi:hypothetical protein